MNEATENKGFIYEFGKFVFDPQERVLLADGKTVHLTEKVFDTLWLFIQHNGRLLTKDEMMSALWSESFVEEGNLTFTIRLLRKALDDSKKKSKAPISLANFSLFMPDMTWTGICCNSLSSFNHFNTVQPSIPGNFMSRIIAFGLYFLAY